MKEQAERYRRVSLNRLRSEVKLLKKEVHEGIKYRQSVQQVKELQAQLAKIKQKYQISEKLREEQLKIIDIQHKKLQKYKSAFKKV